MNRSLLSTWVFRVGIAAGVVTAGVVVFLFANVLVFVRSDRVCDGVMLAGVPLGGKSRAEAEAAARSWWDKRRDDRVVLTALDARESLRLVDLGARFDAKESVGRALEFGRKGSITARIEDIFTSDGSHKRLRPTIRVDHSAASDALKNASKKINRAHRNARLRITDGRLRVEPEQYGIVINENRSYAIIERAIALGRPVIPLAVEQDEPDVKSDDAREIDSLLATFKTPFNPSKRDRTNNLKLAANAVSGVILKPGMKFSYNELVGPRELSRGFRDAPIFVRGKLEPGVGGGICQVSSTVYNAALLAGLKIVERSHHSRIVPYVGPGRDATVNYGLLDLKFVNTNTKPIGLIATIDGSWLRVDLYGSERDRKQVAITTGDARYKPAGVKTVSDSTLPPGSQQILDHGAPGVSITVYRRTVTEDGRAATEVVSRDYYPPQAKLIAHGPKRSPSPTSQRSGPAKDDDGPGEDSSSPEQARSSG